MPQWGTSVLRTSNFNAIPVVSAFCLVVLCGPCPVPQLCLPPHLLGGGYQGRHAEEDQGQVPCRRYAAGVLLLCSQSNWHLTNIHCRQLDCRCKSWESEAVSGQALVSTYKHQGSSTVHHALGQTDWLPTMTCCCSPLYPVPMHSRVQQCCAGRESGCRCTAQDGSCRVACKARLGQHAGSRRL